MVWLRSQTTLSLGVKRNLTSRIKTVDQGPSIMIISRGMPGLFQTARHRTGNLTHLRSTTGNPVIMQYFCAHFDFFLEMTVIHRTRPLIGSANLGLRIGRRVSKHKSLSKHPSPHRGIPQAEKSVGPTPYEKHVVPGPWFRICDVHSIKKPGKHKLREQPCPFPRSLCPPWNKGKETPGKHKLLTNAYIIVLSEFL